MAAAACLGGVYLAAESGFDARWVCLTALSAMVVAWGAPAWTPSSGESPVPAWPSAARICTHLLPGWLLMALTAVAKLQATDPRLLIWVWCAGVLWLILGARQLSRGLTRRSSAAARYSASIWALVVVVMAVLLRVWWIDTVPREVHVDEAFTTVNALIFYSDPARDWFGAATIMNLFYALAGMGTLVFGVNLTGARASDVVFGVLSVWLLFDALRRMSSLRVAVVGALLLAFNHTHLAYSRNAAGYIQSSLIAAAMLALLARLWTRPSYLNAVLLGLVTALAPQTVPASVVAPPLLVATLGGLLLVQRSRLRALLLPLLVAGVTTASAASPFAIGMWQNKTGLTSRSGDVSIFAPHVMNTLKDKVYHTDSTWKVVAGQVWVGLTGFQNGRNAQPQYASGQPMADGYTAALMIPGVIFALARPRQLAAVALCIFAAGNLVLGLGLNYAMGFQRAVGSLPAGMAIAAIGLVQCCEALSSGGVARSAWARIRAGLRDVLLTIAVVACGLANFYIYFIDCRPTLLFGDADSEVPWAAREYGRDYHVHLVDMKPAARDDVHLIIADLPVSYNEKGVDAVTYVETAETTGMDLFILRDNDTTAREALLRRFPNARLQVWRRHPQHGPTLYLVFVAEAPGAGHSAR